MRLENGNSRLSGLRFGLIKPGALGWSIPCVFTLVSWPKANEPPEPALRTVNAAPRRKLLRSTPDPDSVVFPSIVAILDTPCAESWFPARIPGRPGPRKAVGASSGIVGSGRGLISHWCSCDVKARSADPSSGLRPPSPQGRRDNARQPAVSIVQRAALLYPLPRERSAEGRVGGWSPACYAVRIDERPPHALAPHPVLTTHCPLFSPTAHYPLALAPAFHQK